LYILGFMGMTRRLSQNIDPQYHPMLMVASLGVALIAIGITCQIIQIIVSVRDRHKNRDFSGDPWGGRTLEWSTSSPAPFYNFAKEPQINTRDAWWNMKVKEKEFVYQQPTKYEPIHMPKNTSVGIIISVFCLIFGFAMIWHIWWLAIIGFVGIIVSWIGKSFDDNIDYYISVEEIKHIENQYYDELKKRGIRHVN
ncbi:MAG: cytochrome o ubiquinol oxidase subunit I, partial [Arsenophonus sp. NC-QC1-MAG3]